MLNHLTVTVGDEPREPSGDDLGKCYKCDRPIIHDAGAIHVRSGYNLHGDLMVKGQRLYHRRCYRKVLKDDFEMPALIQ